MFWCPTLWVDTRVWDATLAMELPLDNPLTVAPIYWQQFVLHQGAAPSIAKLYTETRTLFQAGLEEAAASHGMIGWAGLLELWLDILPTFFLLQRLAMHCLGPGKTPYPTYMACSSGQHR